MPILYSYVCVYVNMDYDMQVFHAKTTRPLGVWSPYNEYFVAQNAILWFDLYGAT